MHDPVRENLEEYLDGTASDNAVLVVEAHLEQCAECRDQVEQMQQTVDLFAAFRVEADVEPAPGFYAKVMSRVDEQRAPSFWCWLAESAFGRRLAFASAAFAMVLGMYVYTSPAPFQDEPSLAEIPAGDVVLGAPPQTTAWRAQTAQNENAVLANLASFKEGSQGELSPTVIRTDYQ